MPDLWGQKLLAMLLKTSFRTSWSQCKDLYKCGRILVKKWQIQDLIREQNSEMYLKKKLHKWGKNYLGIIVYFETQREKMPEEVRDSNSEIYFQTTKITHRPNYKASRTPNQTQTCSCWFKAVSQFFIQFCKAVHMQDRHICEWFITQKPFTTRGILYFQKGTDP